MPAELALTRPDPTLTMDVLRAEMEAAKRWVDSGMLPSAIKTPQQALTIMSVGREIGIPATYALRNIHVIEGKPTCSAELLMALVRRTYGQAAIRVQEASNERCIVQYRESGWDGVSSLTFSLDDARKAGLGDKPMWKKYPRAMLRSRAVSEAVRTAFPECIAGLYTAEELGADVRVTESGEIEIEARSVTPLTPLSLIGSGDGPPPTPEQLEAWKREWFVMVDGTGLDNEDARHRFIGQYTASEGWPRGKQTASLPEMLARMTKREIAGFMTHTRAVLDDDRRAAEEALAEHTRGDAALFDAGEPGTEPKPSESRYPR